MKLTVISHILNEEILLPFWLNHHKNLFDDGIIINNGSTDGSIELVKDICPNWEIIDLGLCPINIVENKLVEIERRVHGYKIILNTPEFIVHHNLKDYIDSIPNFRALRTKGYNIIETEEERLIPLDKSINILKQRIHGYDEQKAFYVGEYPPEHIGVSPILRNRLLHKFPDGGYLGGRHQSIYDRHAPIDENVPLAWFGWGLPDIKIKKNQGIRQTNNGGWGLHHLWDDELVEFNWQNELKLTYNLTEKHENYRANLTIIK